MTEEEMKLRDEIAIAAMSGILAAIGARQLVLPELANEAYEMADAMLAERKKKR